MEMLFSTSLVALVLSPRLLRILNTKVWQWYQAPILNLLTQPLERHHYRRTHFSYEDSRGKDESKEASSSIGRVNISI
jgi:hypothetical protein